MREVERSGSGSICGLTRGSSWTDQSVCRSDEGKPMLIILRFMMQINANISGGNSGQYSMVYDVIREFNSA